MTSPDPTPPHDPRARRFDALAGSLGIDRLAVAALAVVAIALHGGTFADILAVVSLVGVVASAPLRVGWLAQRWLRKGDRRFGALAVVLFLLPVAGLGLSAVV